MLHINIIIFYFYQLYVIMHVASHITREATCMTIIVIICANLIIKSLRVICL